MKELDEIDRLFQTTFERFELTPDPSVKAFIDSAIASKKKRRRFLFILFPVLVSTTILALTLYFYDLPGTSAVPEQTISQNITPEKAVIPPTSSAKIINRKELKTSAITGNKTQKTRSKQKTSTGRMSFKSAGISTKTTSPNSSKNSSAFSENNRHSANEETLHPDEIKTPSPQSLVKTEIQTPIESEKDPDNENKQDSTATALLTDSISSEIAEVCDTPSPSNDPELSSKKWSLAFIGGWESEKKRPAENFDSTGFSGSSREYARIHGTTFYGKIEFTRKLANRLDGIIGLGFRSSKIKQYGSLYSLDSFLLVEGVSTTPPSDSFAYFFRNQTGTYTYQVNSLLVPIGLSFAIPLSKKFDFRLSGGTEFAYGWLTNDQPSSDISRAKFRPFGWSIWLRPEIHYSFGRSQLFGFGTFNQSLYQQLRWDFESKRNPAFGAGIGWRIQL